jgi:hypothetical protein
MARAATVVTFIGALASTPEDSAAHATDVYIPRSESLERNPCYRLDKFARRHPCSYWLAYCDYTHSIYTYASIVSLPSQKRCRNCIDHGIAGHTSRVP